MSPWEAGLPPVVNLLVHLASIWLAWAVGNFVAYYLGFRKGLAEGRDDALTHRELRLAATPPTSAVPPPAPPPEA